MVPHNGKPFSPSSLIPTPAHNLLKIISISKNHSTDLLLPNLLPQTLIDSITVIIMVNVLYLVSVLAAIAGVDACKRTCSPTGSSGGYCNYNCVNACSSISATLARDTYLAALHSHGYSCSAVGTRQVKCKANAAFGSCYDHYWSCGSGC